MEWLRNAITTTNKLIAEPKGINTAASNGCIIPASAKPTAATL